MNIISSYINQIIMVLFLAIAAFLGTQAKKLYQKYVTTEVKQSVCKTVVRFVEQVYKDLHGEEKLHRAMQRASDILLDYGIYITEEELVSLIEAAVNEFNGSFSKPKIPPDNTYNTEEEFDIDEIQNTSQEPMRDRE